MRNPTPGLLVALALSATSVAAAAPPATRPTADALLQQFAEARPPRFDQSKRDDPQYVATYDAGYKAFLAKRRALARQFAGAYPDDARTPVLLQFAAQAADDEQEKLSLYRTLAARYPDTDPGKEAVAHVRRVDAVGKPFDLSFTDAIGGKKVDLKDLRGHLVLVDFWATWCPLCVAAMPHLKDLYARYHAQGLDVIGVNLDDPEPDGGLAKMKAFVADNHLPWPQYYQGKGWDSEFSSSYGIDQLPAMFLVAPDGTLLTTDADKDLDTLIAKHLPTKTGK